MWQDRLLHCVVFTKTSEEFAPHYLAEIRHDMRQTTTLYAIDDGLSHAACGSVPLAAVRLGVSRAHPAPAQCVPGALQGGFTSAVPSRS